MPLPLPPFKMPVLDCTQGPRSPKQLQRMQLKSTNILLIRKALKANQQQRKNTLNNYDIYYTRIFCYKHAKNNNKKRKRKKKNNFYNEIFALIERPWNESRLNSAKGPAPARVAVAALGPALQRPPPLAPCPLPVPLRCSCCAENSVQKKKTIFV